MTHYSRILFLDIYPDSLYRVSKDTNGGYGTVNNYGHGMVSHALSRMMSREVDWPPLDLMYVASIVRDQGLEVSYSRDPEVDLSTIDYIVMSSSIVAHESELKALQCIVSKEIGVCVIGAFATALSQPYLKTGATVLVGEPESFFMKKGISELVEMKGKAVIEHERVDVDLLPYPAWDIFLNDYELKFGLLNKSMKMAPILGTRGCPYNCHEYCTYPLQQGRRIRGREPVLVADEMDYWMNNHGIDLFIFRDPVFSLNRTHTKELCDELIARKNDYKFIIETHLKNIDDELLETLVLAGMVMIKVGIESIDDEVLSSNNRYSLQLDDQEKIIRKIENAGVQVAAHYIIGMPGETMESYSRTIQYAMTLNTLIAQFSVFTPYPGTPKYADYSNRITANRFEEYTQFKLVFEHENLSSSDVIHMLSKAYRKYYLRLAWTIKYLRFRLRV